MTDIDEVTRPACASRIKAPADAAKVQVSFGGLGVALALASGGYLGITYRLRRQTGQQTKSAFNEVNDHLFDDQLRRIIGERMLIPDASCSEADGLIADGDERVSG